MRALDLANLGPLMGEMLQTATITGEVLGTPSPELAETLRESGVAVYTPHLAAV